ncbi:MAG: GNAT family N-acetyltransferase [Cyanobacteria bacterium J06628_6]
MTSPDYQIRTMTRSELDGVIDWAAAEGWNPGQYDAECFYNTDPTGFWLGVLKGEPIAAISAIKYGARFGFVGFYIVRPDFRRLGYGWQIWQAGLATLRGRNIGLDGVVAQQTNYLKSGFKLAYRNIRYEGRTETVAGNATRLTPLSAMSTQAVVNYDRKHFPADRERFVRGWLAQPGGVALGQLGGDALVGYGVVRPCRVGYKIGPLFAETLETAEEIFLGLRSHLPPQTPFYLDTPEINPAAVALAKKYDMQRVFETARMYTQTPPDLPLDKIFGVTSFELG